MASAAVKLMTADEFLDWQQDKDIRHELVDGIPIEMMTGARCSRLDRHQSRRPIEIN